jgi:hypothetical protein
LSGTGIGDVSQEIGNLEQKKPLFCQNRRVSGNVCCEKTVIRLEKARFGQFKIASHKTYVVHSDDHNSAFNPEKR